MIRSMALRSIRAAWKPAVQAKIGDEDRMGLVAEDGVIVPIVAALKTGQYVIPGHHGLLYTLLRGSYAKIFDRT